MTCCSSPRRALAGGVASVLLLFAIVARAQEPAPPVAPAEGPAISVDPLLMKIVESTDGVVTISEVESAGTAAVSDLRAGDVLLAVNDDLVSSYNDLITLLGAAQPGERLTLKLRRGDETLEKRITAPAEAGQPFEAEATRSEFQLLGMTVAEDGRGRVVVSEVSPETPAEAAGLRVNDVVLNFGGHKVSSADSLFDFAVKLTRRMQPGEELELLVGRGDEKKTIVVVLSGAEGASPAPAGDAPTAAAEAEIVFCMAVREAAGGRVMVVEVMERSPAALAGILPGDAIVTVNEENVRSIADLTEIIQLQEQGSQVPFGILRGEELQITEVLMAPCRETVSPDAAGLEALDTQVRLLEAQILELQRTVDVLSDTIRAMQGAPAP